MTNDEFTKWFYAEYDDLVRSVVSATGADYADVEDAVQIVLLGMFKKWPWYLARMSIDPDTGKVVIGEVAGKPGLSLFFYLRRAVVNAVIRILERRRAEELENDDFEDRDEPPSLDDDLVADRFRACFNKLSDDDRRYCRDRFCLSKFQTPRQTRRVPPALARLRGCLSATRLVFEDLIDMGLNLIVIICGDQAAA